MPTIMMRDATSFPTAGSGAIAQVANASAEEQTTGQNQPTNGILSLREPARLPSMMCYVDNHLLRSAHIHNQPPNPAAVCPICGLQHDKAPVKTTFLPLSPCGHWVHYRCFIWHTTRPSYGFDRCPHCSIQLFEYEGIGMLTLAVRTGVEVKPHALRVPSFDPETGRVCFTDEQEYESECDLIESLIQRFYNAEMARLTAVTALDIPVAANTPGFSNPAANHHPHTPIHSNPALPDNNYPDPADGSPNLVRVYHNILDEMLRRERPKCAWLQFSTVVGFYMWRMLVALKLTRYLLVEHRWVAQHWIQGWQAFEAAKRLLMAQILAEVREDRRG